jgi:uncharacterized membrane protein (UPF0127 family)
MKSRLATPGNKSVPAIMVILLLVAGLAASRADEATAAFLENLDRSELAIATAAGEIHKFEVWIVRNPAERARGLMFVEELEADGGMLFIYPQPQMVGMWMKNTLIPLDMLFVEADGNIVHIAENTVPHSLETVSAKMPVSAVLELRGGRVAELKIAPGDKLRHAYFSPLRRRSGG